MMEPITKNHILNAFSELGMKKGDVAMAQTADHTPQTADNTPHFRRTI
jgi:hypothetical protein